MVRTKIKELLLFGLGARRRDDRTAFAFTS